MMTDDVILKDLISSIGASFQHIDTVTVDQSIPLTINDSSNEGNYVIITKILFCTLSTFPVCSLPIFSDSPSSQESEGNETSHPPVTGVN